MLYNMLGFKTKNVHPQVDALSTYTTSHYTSVNHVVLHLQRVPYPVCQVCLNYIMPVCL